MDGAPLPALPRTCATCGYWTRGWIGPETLGFCTWRESNDRSRQPRMNLGSHYTLSADGNVLETRCDSGCLQWARKTDKVTK